MSRHLLAISIVLYGCFAQAQQPECRFDQDALSGKGGEICGTVKGIGFDHKTNETIVMIATCGSNPIQVAVQNSRPAHDRNLFIAGQAMASDLVYCATLKGMEIVGSRAYKLPR